MLDDDFPLYDTVLKILLFSVKSIVTLLLAYFLLIVFLHFRCVSRLNYYEKQGAVLYPGCKSFFFGNMYDMIEYGKAYMGEEPVCGP